MDSRYDVIVAGAGPAGAQCARDLAARGYRTLVLETEPEEEFPSSSNKSTAGTFPSSMASFGIPDDVVMNYTDSVVIESPNNHFTKAQPGAVLEFADFKRWLVEAGRAEGAEYRFDTRVNGSITEGGRIIGVRFGSEEVYGDIVVDATGPSAILANDLVGEKLSRKNQAVGIEYEMRGVDVSPNSGVDSGSNDGTNSGSNGHADLADAMMLRLDHDIAPGGYSWIFHTGGDTAKVGLCFIQNEIHTSRARDGFTIDDYLQEWIDNDQRLRHAKQMEGKQHRGSAHIQLPSSLSTDNFMAIGDTVPSVDPLWGEGIHKCMHSGRAAATTADYCLMNDEQDTSAERMAVYDKLWHKNVAPTAQKRYHMTQLLYRASNERYDTLIQDMHQVDSDTLAQANSGSVSAIVNLLHSSDTPLLAQYARDQLRSAIPI
jgi:digeranylgeranylglycerophospholipid reductase